MPASDANRSQRLARYQLDAGDLPAELVFSLTMSVVVASSSLSDLISYSRTMAVSIL